MHVNVILLTFRKLRPSLPPFSRKSDSTALGAQFLHRVSLKSHNKRWRCEQIFIYAYTLTWNMTLAVLCCTKLTFGTFRRNLCRTLPNRKKHAENIMKLNLRLRPYIKNAFQSAAFHKFYNRSTTFRGTHRSRSQNMNSTSTTSSKVRSSPNRLRRDSDTLCKETLLKVIKMRHSTNHRQTEEL